MAEGSVRSSWGCLSDVVARVVHQRGSGHEACRNSREGDNRVKYEDVFGLHFSRGQERGRREGERWLLHGTRAGRKPRVYGSSGRSLYRLKPPRSLGPLSLSSVAMHLTTLREGGVAGSPMFPLPEKRRLRFTPWNVSLGDDLPVISSDSTLLYPLGFYEGKQDLAVWYACGCDRAVCVHAREGPLGRLVGRSGSSFAMSGPKMKYEQISDYMRSKALVDFDSVFVTPIAHSVPPKRQVSYDHLVEPQMAVLGDMRAFPAIMEFDKVLNLYNGNELHMRGGGAEELLSVLLQVLPRRRCLLVMAGWNTNQASQEFKTQLAHTSCFAQISVTPACVWPEAVRHFLVQLGARDASLGETTFPARWFGMGEGTMTVRWADDHFHSDLPTDSLNELFDRYIVYLNGGDPPDEECWWSLPPLPPALPPASAYTPPVPAPLPTHPAAEVRYHHAFSLGNRCWMSRSMHLSKRRGPLGPFDYMVSTMPMISHILRDNFQLFLDKARLRKQGGHWGHDLYSSFTRDGVLFRHYKPGDFDETIPRRVERLRGAMGDPEMKIFLVGSTAAAYSLGDASALRESLLVSGVRNFNLTVLVLHAAENHGKHLSFQMGSVGDRLDVYDVLCSGEPEGANFGCASTRAVVREVLQTIPFVGERN